MDSASSEQVPQQTWRISVRLTVYEGGPSPVGALSTASESATSEVEVWISPGGSVAELKAILDSQDLLPSDPEAEGLVVEVRFGNADSPTVGNDATIPQSAAAVLVDVLPVGLTRGSPDIATANLPRISETVTPWPAPSPLLVNPLSAAVSDLLAVRQGASGLPPFLTPPSRELMGPDNTAAQEALAQSLMNNPDTMRQMMNSPLMRQLMSNPGILRSIMDANPQMRELRERNPELNHLLNDPELLRQSVEAMQNPSLMRELISSTDRALSNIDAVPGGFNALRRVYHSIQEPIWDAAVNSHSARGKEKPTPKVYNLNVDKAPSQDPIPNPWARSSVTARQQLPRRREELLSPQPPTRPYPLQSFRAAHPTTPTDQESSPATRSVLETTAGLPPSPTKNLTEPPAEEAASVEEVAAGGEVALPQAEQDKEKAEHPPHTPSENDNNNNAAAAAVAEHRTLPRPKKDEASQDTNNSNNSSSDSCDGGRSDPPRGGLTPSNSDDGAGAATPSAGATTSPSGFLRRGPFGVVGFPNAPHITGILRKKSSKTDGDSCTKEDKPRGNDGNTSPSSGSSS